METNLLSNERKLELTLFGMMPYKVMVQWMSKIDTLQRQNLNMGNYYYNIVNCKAKPELHSMEKLTEPILDGGLIPIVELYNMAMKSICNYIPEYEIKVCDYQENTFGLVVIEKEQGFRNGFSLDIPDETTNVFSFRLTYNNENTANSNLSINQLELFEKLKEWHFNIYDLPSDMYIEKQKPCPEK